MRRILGLRAVVGLLMLVIFVAVGYVAPQPSKADPGMCADGGAPDANGVCRVVTKTDPDKWEVEPIEFCPVNVTTPCKLGSPPAPALPQNTSTVTGDVDVYDVPGGVGTVVGMLSVGQQVTKNCRPDNWCEVPGQGWVWGDFLS